MVRLPQRAARKGFGAGRPGPRAAVPHSVGAPTEWASPSPPQVSTTVRVKAFSNRE